VTVDSALGNIDVQAGMLSMQLGTTGLGNPTNTLTVEAGATFNMYATTSPLNKQIALKDNSTLNGNGGPNTIIGPVNLLGDTGGGATCSIASGTTMTLAGVVSGAGNLTLGGGGTLTLSATNTYTGTTTVNAGNLAVSSAQTGTGAISINDGTTLGVTVSGTNQLSPSSLTLGYGAGLATNTYSGLFSTTTAPINTPDLIVNDPITINITSGSFIAGQTYPLISFGNISGSGALTLGTLPPLVVATLVTNNGTTIALNVTASSAVLIWTGSVNDNWDIGSTANWAFNGVAATYADGNNVQFDDTSTNPNVTLTATVMPKGVFVNNSLEDYSISGSQISGTNGLTKLGTATLTLSGVNTYSGGTTLSAGTLAINSATALGVTPGPFTINGGTIDNTGSSLVAVANNGPQFWNADFSFLGSHDLNLGGGPVTLSGNRQVAANAGTLRVPGIISDGRSNYGLTLAGAGALNLYGANTYTGPTSVLLGTLTIWGNEAAATGGYLIGTACTNIATVSFQSGSVVTVAATNTIQVGNNIASGTAGYQSLSVAANVTNNGTLYDGREGIVSLGSDTVWLQNGDMSINGQGGYASAMTVGSGASFIYAGPDTVKIQPTDDNTGTATLTIAGGTFTTSQGFEQTTDSLVLGTLAVSGGGAIVLSTNVPELIVANDSTPEVIDFTLGSGGAVINTAGFTTQVGVAIGGTGGLTLTGGGTLLLSGENTYTGTTTIDSGTLGATGALNGSVQVQSGGTLWPGAPSFGTLSVAGGLTLAGNLFVEVDKSQPLGIPYLIVNNPTFSSGRVATRKVL
jgi:autotransporter-associated beta strand protein